MILAIKGGIGGLLLWLVVNTSGVGVESDSMDTSPISGRLAVVGSGKIGRVSSNWVVVELGDEGGDVLEGGSSHSARKRFMRSFGSWLNISGELIRSGVGIGDCGEAASMSLGGDCGESGVSSMHREGDDDRSVLEAGLFFSLWVSEDGGDWGVTGAAVFAGGVNGRFRVAWLAMWLSVSSSGTSTSQMEHE